MQTRIHAGILTSDAVLAERVRTLCEQQNWQLSELAASASTAELRHSLSHTQPKLDVIMCDDLRHWQTLHHTSKVATDAVWVLFGIDTQELPADRMLVSLPRHFADEELLHTLNLALNVGRFEDQFFSEQSAEPITNLPHHPELLAAMQQQRGQATGLIIVQIDHAEHLYANLDPVSKTDLLSALSEHLRYSLPARASMGIFDAACFAIWIPQATPAQLSAVADSLSARSRSAVVFRSGELHFTASIGHTFESSLGDPQAMWHAAWLAKEQAKSEGGNSTRGTNDPGDVGKRLPEALERNEFGLALQAQFSLDGQTLRGAEALLRWQGLEVGKIAPDHFIPVAERTGQMARVGDWVMESACRETMSWMETQSNAFTLGVNISPQQFSNGAIFEQIQRICNERWINPAFVELELTHDNLLQVIDEHRATLYQLRDLGVRIAIDNIGVGLVDTQKLLRCPADTLKIDRSVVARLDTDDNAKRLVRHICQISERFSLTSIAVGVETEAQRAFLASVGCDFAQGFLYAEPIDVAAFQTFLQGHYRDAPDLAQQGG